MSTYIGIDLGTSGVKLLLVDDLGEILAEESRSYLTCDPHPNWSEQAPKDWLEATMDGMLGLLKGQDPTAVEGISFGGQMHGLVTLDREDNVLRPAILWNDGRTAEQTEYLNEKIGRSRLTELTGNIAFAGFTAPKLLWMRENEPELFARICKIMLPKDYLAYMLSGAFVTDVSDASGTLLLDVEHRCWSREMCEICGVHQSQLPEIHESSDVVGNIKPEIGKKLGLPLNVKIIIGAGDNAAAAVGTAAVREGDCNVSLGTSGTLFVCADRYTAGANNALHKFCHANNKWHLMGCILSAASARQWWLNKVLKTDDYEGDEEEIPDNTEVIFLPYLCGERSPHNDVNVRGAFLKLGSNTTRGELSRAVMEGVAFALRDCLESAKRDGIRINRTKLCGGGARSMAWRQIVADILNMPVDIPLTEQGPAYGAAMLAMVGCGRYPTVTAAADALVRVKGTVLPDPKKAEQLSIKFTGFAKLYYAVKDI